MRIVSSVILAGAMLASWVSPLWANPASEALVLQGRMELVSRHYPAAELLFAQALAADVTDANASVLHAYSRLLALPEKPAVKELLDRLGTSPSNRFLLHWTAHLTRGGDGKIVLPAGVSSQSLADTWRANVVPELIGVDQDLARVTATNYTITLSAQETATVETRADYADLQLVRAICQGERYLSLTVYGWDLDAQLTALQSFASSTNRTIERFLKENPKLLTFKSAADLQEARQAFSDAVVQYSIAAELIRARRLADIRLFNWDLGQAHNEELFRQALDGLKQSLDGKTLYDGRIDLARQFEGDLAPRKILPRFRGNNFAFGSFPDYTFGGVLSGASPTEVEAFVQHSKKLERTHIQGTESIDSIRRENGALRLDALVQPGGNYTFEWGTSLGRWPVRTNVVAQSGRLSFSIPFEADSLFVRMTGSDPFANSGFNPYRLSGDILDIIELFPEPYPWTSETSLWWEWDVPASGYVLAYDKSLPLGAPGSSTVLLYRGDSIFNVHEVSRLTPVNKGERILLRAVTTAPNATCRLHAEIIADGFNYSSETAAVLSGPNAVGSVDLWGAVGAGWFRWTAPASGFYQVQVNNPLVKMDVYHIDNAGTKTLVRTGGAPGLGIRALAGEELYFALFYDFRSIYGGATLTIQKYEAPANDDFGSPAILAGQQGEFHGDIRGSSLQEGEPAPPGAGGSVWFKWTAPSTGFIDVDLNGSQSALKLSVFSGETPASIEPVPVLPAANPLAAAIPSTRFATTMGQTYRFQLVQTNAFWRGYTLAFQTYLPPDNDDLANATVISGSSIAIEGTTFGSNFERFESGWWGSTGGSVWYAWTAPASGMIHPEAKRGAGRKRVGWSTDPTHTYPFGGDPYVLAGETYYFAVWQIDDQVGPFVFELKFWQ